MAADRTIVQGDRYPPLRGQASDETGVLDLTTASSLQVRLKSGATLVTGTPVADTPPITDADGIHHWNWHYAWGATDTSVIGIYACELKVTWPSALPQTFQGPTVEVVAPNT